MRGRRWFHVIATPRATVSFVKWTVNRSPRVLHRCAITIVPLTRHAISDRVYYATYLSIDVLRQCRTTACAPSEEEEAGRRMFASSGRARFRVSVLLLVRFLSSPRITAAYHSRVSVSRWLHRCACVCIYIYTSLPCENAMSMMRAIDVIDCPFFPFLEVVSYHEILYVTCVFFFYTIDNVTRRLRI